MRKRAGVATTRLTGGMLSTALTPIGQDPAFREYSMFRLCQVSNAVAPRWTWLIAAWLLEEFRLPVPRWPMID